jgi:hypothetical protein
MQNDQISELFIYFFLFGIEFSRSWEEIAQNVDFLKLDQYFLRDKETDHGWIWSIGIYLLHTKIVSELTPFQKKKQDIVDL